MCVPCLGCDASLAGFVYLYERWAFFYCMLSLACVEPIKVAVMCGGGSSEVHRTAPMITS